jgi:hypothetical protein
MVRSALRNIERFARGAAKSSEFTWRYGANLAPTLAYKFGAASLGDEARRILTDLDRDGIAIANAVTLVGQDAWNELFEAAEQMERSCADKLDTARADLLGPVRTQKPFVVPLLGDHPTLVPTSVLGRFSLHPAILQVVNAYYGMYVRLRHYNIWHNLVTDRPAMQSQLWHRDPEDLYILKLFVTLGDVDDGNGPFTYAAGSHRKGPFQTSPAYLHKDGETTRSDDDQMAAVVPPERWVKGVGPKGTMIFADTRGYHRGGLARQRDRKMFLSEYTSRAGGRGGISTDVK